MQRQVSTRSPGDQIPALCEECGAAVTGTFRFRDVPFSDGIGFVKDILTVVCDQCDSVIAIPAQSTPAIKAAREAVAHLLP